MERSIAGDPTAPARLPPGLLARLLITLSTLLLATLPGTATAELMPEAPPPGLRMTVGMACDFEERWWEATLYLDEAIPLIVKWRERGNMRERTFRMNPDDRLEIYALGRDVLNGFSFGRDTTPNVDPDVAWLGERTVSMGVLVLDDAIGRVDRVEVQVDVIPGRRIPERFRQLVARLHAYSGRVDIDLDCR